MRDEQSTRQAHRSQLFSIKLAKEYEPHEADDQERNHHQRLDERRAALSLFDRSQSHVASSVDDDLGRQRHRVSELVEEPRVLPGGPVQDTRPQYVAEGAGAQRDIVERSPSERRIVEAQTRAPLEMP